MPLRHSVPAVQAAPSALRFVQMPDWQVYVATQSALVVQVVRQAVPPHWRWPGHGVGVWAQVPAPSQVPPGLLIAFAQAGAPQLVPKLVFRQAPIPLQVPSKPQGGAGVQRWWGSALPTGTELQVPALPVRLQTWQVPQVGAEQQTPSTQLLLAHSVPSVQIWPRRLRPHDPFVQNWPGAQSASAVQTATQLWVVLLQANGAQDCIVAGLQLPIPSQVRARFAVVAVAHAGAAHWVPAG